MATREIRHIPHANIIRQFMKDDGLSQHELAHCSYGAFKKSAVSNLIKPKPGQGVNQQTAQAVAKFPDRHIDPFLCAKRRKWKPKICTRRHK